MINTTLIGNISSVLVVFHFSWASYLFIICFHFTKIFFCTLHSYCMYVTSRIFAATLYLHMVQPYSDALSIVTNSLLLSSLLFRLLKQLLKNTLNIQTYLFQIQKLFFSHLIAHWIWVCYVRSKRTFLKNSFLIVSYWNIFFFAFVSLFILTNFHPFCVYKFTYQNHLYFSTKFHIK